MSPLQRGTTSVDQVNQRVFEQGHGLVNGQRVSIDEIVLFKENRHYMIKGGGAGAAPTCHYQAIPSVS